MIGLLRNNMLGIFKNKLVQGTGIFGIGVFISGIINYTLQVALGRMLSVENFGLFNALLSLTYVLTVPSNAFTMSAIKVVAKLKSEEKLSELTHLYWKLTQYTLGIGMLFALLVIVLRSSISSYLNIENSIILFPFAVYIGFAFLNTPTQSYLQGLLRFKGFAFHSVITSFIRAVCPILMVYLGYAVGGVYSGLALALFLAYVIGTVILRKNLVERSSFDLKYYYKSLAKLSSAVLLIQVSLAFLSNIDLILVRHFFDETSVGLYASVLTIGKVLLFGTGIISTVMFPIIADSYQNNTNYVKKFYAFFALQFFAVVCGVILFSTFPEIITKIMFGERYLSAIFMLPRLVLFVGLYSLTNSLVLFCLAIERLRVYYALLATVLLQFTLINLYHSTLLEVIKVNTIALGLLFTSIAFYLFYEHKFGSYDKAFLND